MAQITADIKAKFPSDPNNFWRFSPRFKNIGSLADVQTTVDLIGSTQTTKGLRVVCIRDDTEYELARKVSDEEFAGINIEKIGAFGAWNYRISPQ